MDAHVSDEKAPAALNVSSLPTQSAADELEINIIHREPPMSYQPPTNSFDLAPVRERPPRMVTPLSRLGTDPADVDCPYCRRVTRTVPREVSSSNDGMMLCLLCLVCWPLLLCYQGDKDLDHYCSVCRRQLTHKAAGNSRVEVVAILEPEVKPSIYEQSQPRQCGS